MAKKLSKKQRKIQKQKQQNKLINQGFKKTDVQQLSNADLKKLAISNIPQNKKTNTTTALKYIEQREKKREYNRQYRQRKQKEKEYLRGQKLQELEKLTGTNAIDLTKKPTAKFLDSLDLDKLKNRQYSRKDFLEYIPEKNRVVTDTFDFDYEYKLPEKQKLYFSFRSLDGEFDIADELNKYNAYTNEQLISELNQIKNMPLTGSRNVKGFKGRNIGSSGKAGQATIKYDSQSSLYERYTDEYNANRRAKSYVKKRSKSAEKKGVTFQHTEIDYHWQVICQIDKDGKQRAYEKISPRKLLVIANAIMHNIREDDRTSFYDDFYAKVCDAIPDMKKILP